MNTTRTSVENKLNTMAHTYITMDELIIQRNKYKEMQAMHALH